MPKTKSCGKVRAKAKSCSSWAGLRFPVGLGTGAPVYMAGILEYLTAEVLELAGNTAWDKKKKKHTRISPHLQLAIRNDKELNKLLGKVTVSQGGPGPEASCFWGQRAV
uniref:Histone H2A n=1 Tax=Gopherus agassizii TaxID=38772 RepID=A0A452IVZ1_9SAUR